MGGKCSEMDNSNLGTSVNFNVLNMYITADFNKIEYFVRMVLKIKINNVNEFKTGFITIIFKGIS